MIKIKETNSIGMFVDDTGLVILTTSNGGQIAIPMKSIFQVQRGITSTIQRLYRKNAKKK